MMNRRYWVTTQWPPSEGEEGEPDGVYLPDGREAAGENLSAGDLVLIYESRSGRRKIRTDLKTRKRRIVPRNDGHEGVIAIVEAVGGFEADESIEPEEYVDGTSIRWNWRAAADVVNLSGFVDRRTLNRHLGYKPGYRFRGFGTLHSGLKEIDENTYRAVVASFNKNAPIGTSTKDVVKRNQNRNWGFGGGGEGPEHKALKMRVFETPSDVLGIPGLRGVQTEFGFISNDSMDVLLEDENGRPYAVEIKVDIGKGDLSGVLQAIKYRHMYAVMSRRSFNEVEAVLVAHGIARDVRRIAEWYGVNCIEVRR